MNYFTIVRDVLNESIPTWHNKRGLSRQFIKKKMTSYLERMSAEWLSGERPLIPYEKPLCRLAYLYRHVAANANLFQTVLRSSPTLRRFVNERLSKGSLGVAAFGGGPGTELLGLAKHISENIEDGQGCHIRFTVVDRVQEWADNWGRLLCRVRKDPDIKKLGTDTVIETMFISLDLTNHKPFGRYEYLLNQDLYVFNYVLSEVADDADSVQDTIAALANSADVGAHFIVIDRNQKSVRALSRKILQDAGLTVGKEVPTKTNMDTDEQCSVLARYTKWLDDMGPRTTWDSFWVVGLKK